MATALALVQTGTLSLDEDVNVKLKSWHIPESEFTGNQKVTLRRLLNHSAGVNVSDVGSYAAGEPLPTLVQALDGSAPAHSDPIRVDVVPGTKWRYSGGGYSVIQQLLIDVTGTPFPQLMQNRALTKIGMIDGHFFMLDFNFDAAFVRNSHGDVSESRFTIDGQTVVATKLALPK